MNTEVQFSSITVLPAHWVSVLIRLIVVISCSLTAHSLSVL
jgi:hypothetical protein